LIGNERSVKSHLPEYFAEFLGTAIMMIVGIGAVTVMWSDGSVMRELIPNEPLRRLCTGLLFAGGGTAIVLSPLGQRGGGHSNPAVTLAFWVKGQVTGPDAIAYCVAQMLGAVMGVVIVALVGGAAAQSVQLGLTTPGAEYSTGIALGAEFVITFMLMFTILYCVNEPRHAARTPYFAGLLVALLVFVEAPVSGTSLNPARSFAPALLTSVFDGFLVVLRRAGRRSGARGFRAWLDVRCARARRLREVVPHRALSLHIHRLQSCVVPRRGRRLTRRRHRRSRVRRRAWRTRSS
jgi:aquaporin Z